MPDDITANLRQAGFNDGEIGDWVSSQRDTLVKAGFGDNDIQSFASGLKQPGTIPSALVDRVDVENVPGVGPVPTTAPTAGRIAGAVKEGAQAGFGEGQVGLSPESTKSLEQGGVFRSPTQGFGGPAGGIRFANESLLKPMAAGADFIMRGLNASLMGIGAALGQTIEETKGGDETQQAKARHDWANMLSIAGILAGAHSPMVKSGMGGAAIDDVIGHLPSTQDFTDATKIVSDGQVPPLVRDKIVQLYEDHGIHPAEVAQDAMHDATVKQALLSDKPDELPGKYMPPGGFKGGDELGRLLGTEPNLSTHFDKLLSDDGIETGNIPFATRARSLELMEKEQLSPINAYERAIMEEVYYGAEKGENGPVGLGEQINGWSGPNDAGPMARAGGEPSAIGEGELGAAGREYGERNREPGQPAVIGEHGSEPERANEPNIVERSEPAAVSSPQPDNFASKSWLDEALGYDSRLPDIPIDEQSDYRAMSAEARNQSVRSRPLDANDTVADRMERHRQQMNDADASAVFENYARGEAGEPETANGGSGNTWNGGGGISGGDVARAFNEMDRGPQVKYLNLANSKMISPRMLSTLDTRFSKLYDQVTERSDIINREVNQSHNRTATFRALPASEQNKVLAVMELERLRGEDYNINSEGLTNDTFQFAQGTTMGESVRLDGPAMQAHQDMRQMLRDRWSSFREAWARHMEIEGEPTSTAVLQKAARLGTGSEQRRLQRVGDFLMAIEQSERQGYIPLMRWGDQFIHVRGKQGVVGADMSGFPPTEWFGLVDSRSSLARLVGKAPETVADPILGRNIPVSAAENIAELRKRFPPDKYDIDTGSLFAKPEMLRKLDIPAIDKLMTLMGQDMKGEISKQLGEGATSAEIAAKHTEFWNNMIDSLHDQIIEEAKAGFRKQAKNTPGYDGDFRRALGQYINWTSHYVGDLNTRDKISSIMQNDIARHPDPAVREYAQNWLNFLDTKPDAIDKGLSLARQASFLWALGGNFSSFANSLLHDPINASALIGVGMGQARAMPALLSGMTDVLKGIEASVSRGLYINPEKIGSTPAEKAFINTLLDSGALHAYGARTLAGIDSLETPGELSKGVWQKTMEIASSFMRIADVTNRGGVALAAFREAQDPMRLALANQRWSRMSETYRRLIQREGATPETFARFMVDQTAGISNPANRPPVMRGKLGATEGQFKTFVATWLSNAYFLGTKAGPEGKIAATMMLGTLASLGGINAMPFIDDVKTAVTWLSKLIGGIDPEINQHMDDLASSLGMNKIASDAVLHGIPYATLGVDLGSRLGFGEEMRRNLDSPLGAMPNILGHAVSESWNRYSSGQSAAAVAAAASPNAIKNVLLGTKVWPEQGIRTQYGAQVLTPEQLSPTDRFWRTIGYQPASVANRYEKRKEMLDEMTTHRNQAHVVTMHVADMVVEAQKARQQGQDAAAVQIEAQMSKFVNDAAQRGLIMNAEGFRMSVAEQIKNRYAPELSEILKLPKAMRSKYMQKMQ